MLTIDSIKEEALVTRGYWQRLPWEQFLSMAEQAYLKLNSALDDLNRYPVNSGKRIDAQARVNHWNQVTWELDRYARTEIPYWMYEIMDARVIDALNTSDQTLIRAND